MKKLIILSYDLGVDGDYKNLYKWLDSMNASFENFHYSVATITNMN